MEVEFMPLKITLEDQLIPAGTRQSRFARVKCRHALPRDMAACASYHYAEPDLGFRAGKTCLDGIYRR